MKFRVRRVEHFLGKKPRQGDLFPDAKDTPLAVRELKNAGLAADEAWKMWQEGFRYVDEDKRSINIGENPEAAFDKYVLEKIHLLRRRQAEQKVKNMTGFPREAIRKNYANPEFAVEEKKKRVRGEAPTEHLSPGARQLLEEQKNERETARDAETYQLCESILKEMPSALEEATAHIFKENPLLRKMCEPEKALWENYREKPMLRAMVNQYLMEHHPERFQTIRKRSDARLAILEAEAVVTAGASA